MHSQYFGVINHHFQVEDVLEGKLARRGKCSKVKAETLKKRLTHAIATECIAMDMTDPEEILAHLKEHKPELVRSGKGFIRDTKKMMRQFHEWQRQQQ